MFENDNERKLTEGLRAVAGMAPEASPQLRLKLQAAFRQHASARRRRQRIVWMGAAAGVVAMLICGVVLVRMRSSSPKQKSNTARLGSSGPSVTVHQPEVSVLKAAALRSRGNSRKRRRPVTPRAEERVTEFVSLPYSNPSLPLDEVEVLRVELPASALRLAGIPVTEERALGRVTADVVIGADSQPRAIRFVM